MTCDLCGQEVTGDLDAHYRNVCNVKPERVGLWTPSGNQPETRAAPKQTRTEPKGSPIPEPPAQPGRSLWTPAGYQRRTPRSPGGRRIPNRQRRNQPEILKWNRSQVKSVSASRSRKR
jgi:hypothetical protein